MVTAAAQEEVKDTECTICHEAFTVPKILPCGHVLCRHCLLYSWLQNKQEAQCPLCRYPIVDGALASGQSFEDVADSFPTHLLMAAMLEAERLLSGQQVCCVHDKVAAVSLCLNCRDMFCQGCTEVHKKQSLSKHHQVENLTALTADELTAKRPETCSIHATELAQLYCPTHSVYACIVCATSDHRQCPQMVKLDTRVAESRGLLTQVAATLKAGERKLEEGIEEMEDNLKKLEKQTESGISEIEALCQRVEKAADACRQRLKNEIQSTSGSLKEKMLDGKAVLLKERGRFSTHSKIVQQAEAFSTHGSFGDMAAMMKKRADSLECSDGFMASVNMEQKMTLTFDLDVVARIERELSQIGCVSTVDTSIPVLRFDNHHGNKIKLSNGGQTAAKTNISFGGGVVISKDPMKIGLLYEVRVDTIHTGGNNTFVGVVTCQPDTFKIPDDCINLLRNDILCVADSRCSVFGKRVNKGWSGLAKIQGGTLVGLVLNSERSLYLFVNGKNQGIVSSNVTDPCYFMFDLYSRCVQVTAQALRTMPGM